ncbi:helix-turn-helix domain-containing protein [Streptococcus sp. S784/96/1]|uniref:helix-turn-helix domain-containing protein n=1 Tax=Streptococcus sp. S784/96/1 TaxID=2653499 RepID=UPI003083D9F3
MSRGKLEIVLKYPEGPSIGQLIKEYQVSDNTIKEWLRKYQTDGIDSLKENRTWTHYSLELKQTAIEKCLPGQGILRMICHKYNISNTYVLRRWLKKY